MARSPVEIPDDGETGERREVSLGEQVTGADVEAPRPGSQRSLGDQSTTGDMDSSLSGLDELGSELVDGVEIVDLQARYEIQETLGRGGMGEVVKAIDRRLDRIVAIKRLREELGDSRKAAERFLTEAKSIAALNQFNIVQIHDYGHAADGPFIVMEYVAGGTLSEALSSGPFELDRAIEVGCRLCDALSVAHRQGIVHRDIKPANVVMTTEGVPKLTDFGLARLESVDRSQTQSGAVLGTLDFMPPEQRTDATQADARSDLWSLAATLYQVVTGEIPRVIVMDQVPDRIRAVLGIALRVSPEDRFQSAEEFREALRAVGTEVKSEVDDLEEGACPSCGTRNDTSRKFCRNCAASLEMACLSCETIIAMWEDVCGSCGTRQSEVTARRRAEMQSRQEQAESHRAEFRYAEAVQIAAGLRDEPDGRFHQLKDWAEQFIEDVQREEGQQRERMRVLMEEALAHEEASDYPAGIQALEQVPEPLCGESVPVGGGSTGSVDGTLSRLRQCQKRSQDLDRKIRDRVKRRDLDGLISDVDLLLQLRPDRRDLPKLRKQLESHEAREQEKVHQQHHEQIRRAEQAGETNEMLGLLETYLELNPDDERMLAVQVQVEERLESERARREEQQLQELTQQRAEWRAANLSKVKRAFKFVAQLGGGVVLLVVIGLSWKAWGEFQRDAAEKEARRIAAGKENSRIVAERQAEQVAEQAEADRKEAEVEKKRREVEEEARKEAKELVAREFAMDKAASRLQPISVQSVEEGEELSVSVEVVDPTRFGGAFVYELVGAKPAGCRLDGRTGVLTWTPGETDGGNDISITVRARFVVSAGIPASRSELTNDRKFVVTVKEGNRPPVAAAVPDQRVDLGKTLRLQLAASDPDVPANTLSFRLNTDAPTGASIDRETGELEWTPVASARPGKREFSVLVSDDGMPSGVVSVTVRVTVFKQVLGAGTLARTIKGHTGGITCACFSPDGKWVISGSGYHTLKTWDVATGREMLTLKGHADDVTSLDVSPDGKRIVSGSRDRTVKVWDATTGRETMSLNGHVDVVAGVSFSPDGSRILSGSWDKTLKVWDAKTGRMVRTFEGHLGAVYSVCFSSDGKRIASGSYDRTVKIWDATTGKQTVSLTEPAPVYSVSFSPDGKRLLSASRGADGKVMVGGVTLWELIKETELHSRAHPGGTNSVKFSGDGKWIVLGHHDSSVEVWDAATGETTLTLRGHSKRVRSVGFSRDGKRIVSGGDDSTVKVWHVRTILSSGSATLDEQPKSRTPGEAPRS